jgi:hypothetical protein
MARTHYWSCTKFADWVRGTRKPEAVTCEQWDEWQDTAKGYNPLRYWLAEEGLDYISNVVYFIPDKLYDVKYYINNRWVTKTHALTAHPRDIQRGSWRDVGDRFLPCLFNELVDFVEVELAWWHIAWDSSGEAKKYKPPFWARGWFRWRTWRCPQAGLDNLEWQRKLVWNEDEFLDKDDPRFGTPTSQAIKAQEILDLYTWWTCTRVSRPDPYEVSGWTAHCEAMREKYGGGIASWGKEDKKERAQSTKARKLLDKMEADYEKEDEAMMIRLIRVRRGLWT